MKTFPTTTKITTILNNKFLLTSISWCKHYSVVSMSLKNDQCLWTPCISCYSWSLAMLVKKLFSPYFSIQPPFSKTFYFSQLSKPDWNLTFVLKEFPLSFGQAKIYSCLFQTWVMSTLCFPLSPLWTSFTLHQSKCVHHSLLHWAHSLPEHQGELCPSSAIFLPFCPFRSPCFTFSSEGRLQFWLSEHRVLLILLL